MAAPSWQLQTPINTLVFDCDGTLSTIEGIDELAKNNGVGKEVQDLTAYAMGQTGINPSLYQKRLDLVKPTQEQVVVLGQNYFKHAVPDGINVIKILNRLNKKIFLISAGLYPAVKIFGELLKISRDNILAVNIQFDKNGNYVDFDRRSPFTQKDGKRKFVDQLKKLDPNIIFTGDGLNDLSAYDLVTRFIGFGGSFYHEKVAEQCQFYINILSMAPLLPLCLTQNECEKLTSDEKHLYQKGIAAIETGRVKF